MSIQIPDDDGGIVGANEDPLYAPDGEYSGHSHSPDNGSETSASTVPLSTSTATAVDVPLAPTDSVQNPNICGVCKTKEMKYKCSRCYLPYCSVVCSTIHKEGHPLPPAPVAKPQITAGMNTNVAPRAGTVGFQNPFAPLQDSAELRALFKQYPNLHNLLSNIYAATQPPINRPDDMYSKLTGKHNHQTAWNQDRGTEKGLLALRTARHTWGEDGEGLREFEKLVLRIVQVGPADEVLQREEELENARIIRALLNGDM